MTTTTTTTDDGHLWYFSFGANMDKHVLQKRRQVIPKESVACRVPGYRINFNLRGIMYLEPAFASIEKVDCGTDDSMNEMHGVAHLITPEEYLRIRHTEGGSGHEGYGYSDVDVPCIDYNGREFIAKALISVEPVPKSPHLPSKRYLSLLRRGAREHNLDQKWIDYLDQLEPYEHDWRSKVAIVVCFPLLLFTLLPFLSFLFYNLMTKTKRTPLIAVQYFYYAHIILWTLHDWIFVHLFGSGRCNTNRKKASTITDAKLIKSA